MSYYNTNTYSTSNNIDRMMDNIFNKSSLDTNNYNTQLNTYMYLSSVSNSSYSSSSSQSSSSYRNLERTPSYTIGQWSISGKF